jgi:hypothetical protein
MHVPVSASATVDRLLRATAKFEIQILHLNACKFERGTSSTQWQQLTGWLAADVNVSLAIPHALL